MENVNFSHGVLKSTHVRFAIVPGGHIRLKSGILTKGSLIVDAVWVNKKVRLNVSRVEGGVAVSVGRDYEPSKKSAILDVVKDKLLELPTRAAAFAVEGAWRAIMARKALE